MKKNLTIVIPAYNESEGLEKVLLDLQAETSDLAEEIILVDDGSQDDTAAIAKASGVRVISHKRNIGYGASLKSGIRTADTDYILTMDSDGQHHPDDVNKLWQQVEDFDMVIGSRTSLLHSPIWRMPGKWLLNIMANFLVRQRIPDLNSGLRIIRREDALRYLHLCPAGFSFSTTITLVMLSRGYDVKFVPIEVSKRVGVSYVSIKTGFETLLLIMRLATLIDPLRIFVPVSLLIGLVGFLWEIPYAVAGRGVSVGSMLAIVTALLCFVLGLISDQISQLRLERYE